ncbi:hypothetical protein Q2T94_09930 [Paeniglutamicibacter sulfureus]|jgi:hypothetical protein|uniref:recombinase-like helix-turn-helix domain-containing protein n=1 Tax=Paeniglutamicibacter sulfureus TaxID=43666 RepID=UPI0026671CB1|nr:recombinase-like helix-turn-helix domain-containing protein [Paeniglutamicibacter sulfureus]MDO2934620.1 hypothetical protein [Paeniglutamicibacter sulfureus]
MSEQYLEPNQTRNGPATAYELKLAGSLSEVFSTGTHDLPGIINGLNALGLHAPGGTAWNEENFRAEMKRLGA